MKQLLKYFPRELGMPWRLSVVNMREFLKIINANNGIKTLFYSLYDYEIKVNEKCNCFTKIGEIHYCRCKLDKIFFDTDSKNSFEVVEKFVFNEETKKYKKMIVSKGDKSHIYIFTKNYDNIKDKKECLKNAHNHFIKILNLKVTDNPEEDDIDFHITGDIARIVRVPNTFHLNSKNYYVPLTLSDIEKGKEFVKEKAKKQCFKFTTIGEEEFDISKFDYESKESYVDNIPDYDYKFEVDDKLINSFLPCVKRILLEKGVDTYDARYIFAVYCAEIGLPKGVCDDVAKKYFSKTKRSDRLMTNYDHFRKFKVLEYAYSRGDFFPACEKMFEKKLCLGKCDKYGRGVYL